MSPSSPSQRLVPREVDARSREEAVTLADIRRVIASHCFKPVEHQSFAALGRVLGMIALCLVLLRALPLTGGVDAWWQVPALLAIWTLHGFALLGLFVIGHDCGHGSFSSKRWVNTLVGHLCMSPLSNGFRGWQVTHNHHHAHTQERGHEIDWSEKLVTQQEFAALEWKKNFLARAGYALPVGAFFWIACNVIRRAVLKHEMLRFGLKPTERRGLLLSNLAMAASMTALYAGLWFASGFWGMLMYHGIPATIGMLMGYLILTIQHANPDTLWYERHAWTPLRGQLVSTFDVRFPRLLEWLWCDINIHIPHHVAPNIPWYFLREATDAIRREYPGYHQERQFSVGELSWLLRTPVLEHVPELGYYVMAARK